MSSQVESTQTSRSFRQEASDYLRQKYPGLDFQIETVSAGEWTAKTTYVSVSTQILPEPFQVVWQPGQGWSDSLRAMQLAKDYHHLQERVTAPYFEHYQIRILGLATGLYPSDFDQTTTFERVKTYTDQHVQLVIELDVGVADTPNLSIYMERFKEKVQATFGRALLTIRVYSLADYTAFLKGEPVQAVETFSYRWGK